MIEFCKFLIIIFIKSMTLQRAFTFINRIDKTNNRIKLKSFKTDEAILFISNY